MRHRTANVTACLLALIVTAIAGREHFARGGPHLARTIASGSSNSPKSAEETLLLFEYATKEIPRGASVTVLKPHSRGEDKQVLRFSHGQLPYHRVVPQSEAPDFIITLGSPLQDDRYELLHREAAGDIWKRTRW